MSSKQTKTHSRDPRRTTGLYLPGSSPEDSAPHLRLPAKEHLEYQHWYENDSEKKGFSFVKLYNDFLENPSSSTLSVIVIVFVTIFAILVGFLAIRFLPVPKTAYTSQMFRWNSYRKTHPDLIGYESLGALLVPMEKPVCFAVDAGNRLYIGGDRKILVFGTGGETLATLPLKDNPTCLGIPGSGALFEKNLLIGYPGLVEVCKILPDHKIDPKPVFRWELPGEIPYLKKACTDTESLILADAGEKGVYRIDAEGNILLRIGFHQWENVDGFSGFSIPALPFLDVVESPNESILYITNPGKHRIEAFTKTGVWLPERSWGAISVYHEGFCGCCNPSGISRFQDGRFLSTEKYISRVKVYESSGTFRTIVASPEELERPPTAFLNAPAGTKLDYRSENDAMQPVQAAITPDGRIAVLDPRYCCVRFYREKTQ